VSTVPSQTELLADLGLEEEVVGITGYCVHPQNWREEKTVIGGTKDLQLAKIKALKPDLIIGNKEENVKEQIESLAAHIPVWLSDITTVQDALQMIKQIGKITQREKHAQQILEAIKDSGAGLTKKPLASALYFIWKEPFMVAGSDSFISALLKEAGLQNVAPKNTERYPKMSLSEVKENRAQLILLSSEPYAFTTADAHFLATATGKKVKIVDGELFSWYGSRMVKTFPYLRRLQAELALTFNA
jgi:ABC-type Fe3+-hydroxamate transport system substrate-binding protein